ncbi:MAG: hypothetical protein GWN09_08355 [Gammaproteobacteria bacterium]|nr:hypothetical protein [Gammaproteobacteria bacterium]
MTTGQDIERNLRQSEAELQNMLNNPQSRAEIDIADRGLSEIHAIRRRMILEDFNKATAGFVEYTELLQGVIDNIRADSPASARLRRFNGLLDAASTVFSAVREPERFASATDVDDITIPLPVADEQQEPPSASPPPTTSPGAVSLPPINAREYPVLKDEYVAFFHAATVRPESAGDLSFYVSRMNKHRARYEEVGEQLGIPWFFIGCIHALESSFDFNTHLFNGDPLTARTVHVPAGQPEAAPANGTRYTWKESAHAAIVFKGLHQNEDWSLPRILYRWESYNGFGYRSRNVPTPYLWSFSSLYSKGRFVADHQFDENAVSKQAGAAVILKSLVENGSVVV